MALSTTTTRLQRSDVSSVRRLPSLADDARAGLLLPPRWLAPKYFYDDHGSRLFETICDTPEYYPTRTEAALLKAHAARIVERTRPAHILELGSGNSRKTECLIAACDEAAIAPVYWPFDVSAQMMMAAGEALVTAYEWLRVHALVGDYHGGLGTLPLPEDDGRRLIVFLGGTLGNFEPAEATGMLREIRSLMAPGDALLLGLDRVKDKGRLEAAYDDAAGHTAAFNRNVLSVLNRELGADFPLPAYRHSARYDAEQACIEMRLIAQRAHSVRIGALAATIEIGAEESILTEISRKFTAEAIDTLLASAGLRWLEHFEAGDGDYSLLLAGPATG